MLDPLPNASALLGDKGYDADWFRAALAGRGITACIPSKANRKLQIPHDRALYRQRDRVENMFGKLKDWRRIHTRVARPELASGTAAPTPSYPPSASPQLSSSGSINEMGWLPPSLTASRCAKIVVLQPRAERTATMSIDTIIGVDLAKSVFQVHGASMSGEIRSSGRLNRGGNPPGLGPLKEKLLAHVVPTQVTGITKLSGSSQTLGRMLSLPWAKLGCRRPH